MKPIKGKVSQITTHSKEYKIVTNSDFRFDYDYGWNFNHGLMPNHKWREFKTWKYNRKTRWK